MNRPAHLRTASPEFRFRNKLIAPVVGCGLILFLAGFARGGSAIWDHNPGSSDWNTGTNWTPATVPNGPSDTAFFDLSNTTALSISANTEVNGIVFDSNAGLNPYTITASPGFTLTISGVGITNDSGTFQSFGAAADFPNAGTIVFSNGATAGSNVFFSIGSEGTTSFFNRSTAGSASFISTFDGSINFFNRSSAGSADIQNEQGIVSFSDRATAGNATIFTDGGGVIEFFDSSTAGSANISGTDETFIRFFGTSTAGSATISSNGFSVSFVGSSTAGSASIELGVGEIAGELDFNNSSSAGSATIINEGAEDQGFHFFFATTVFGDTSTAGNATIIANGGPDGGGQILFGDNSTGGASRIEVFGNGFLDISGHNAPGVTIGSIEGDGNVFLGANNLTVGSNNLSTTFSGVMQDGSLFGGGGTGGSLTKIGTGTLDLTGANTYTGNTNINRGVLKVDGSITSNTFVNHGGTLAGTGTVGGNVTNAGVVSPGDAPGTLTVNGNYTQASNGTLLIDIAGANADEFSVLNVLGTANLSGLLDPVLLNGFVPTIGESFTFLDYGAVTGTLDIFDRNIDSVAEHWVVTYQPTHAILTVAAGNVSVPDQGSTFLLLTLGLLGLATYRQKCWE